MVLIIFLSILSLDHFACKMSLLTNFLYIKYHYNFFPLCILVPHSVEEILFVVVAWCRRINNLHNSKYTFQIVRIIFIEWKLPTNLSLLIALIITLFLYSVTITRCFTYKPFSFKIRSSSKHLRFDDDYNHDESWGRFTKSFRLMELYHENEMWVSFSKSPNGFLIHQGIYKKFVISTNILCCLMLVYKKGMSHGCSHPKGFLIHQGLYRKSVMSTALLAVAENSWVSSSKRNPHPWRPTLEVSNANSVSCCCCCFCRCFKKRKITRGCSRSCKQASPYATEDRESLPILLVPVYYPLLMALLFLIFFCKSDFCFLIVNCNSERFAKFQVSQWQWNSWDWVVMFCVSFFLFPMFQWHDTKLNPPFFFVSSENILGFAAADQTFDLGALY